VPGKFLSQAAGRSRNDEVLARRLGAPSEVGDQPPEAAAPLGYFGRAGQNILEVLVKGVGVVAVVPEAGFRGPAGAADYIGRRTAVGKAY